jgi:hypothetical protein
MVSWWDKARSLSSRIPPQARYVAILLIVSRVILSAIGVASRFLLAEQCPYFGFSDILPLSVWGQWDTNFFVPMIEHGYQYTVAYSFLPLFPLIARLVNYVVQNPFIAALIVSNAALVVSCYYMYKLVKLDNDAAMALRSVKYLVLWPTAFVLGGAFTESTFLAFCLAAFYYAKKGDWRAAGIAGIGMVLARNIGIFALVPLGYMYMEQRQWRTIQWNALWLSLMPLAYGGWLAFNYIGTGSALTFARNQEMFGRGWYSIWNVFTVGLQADAVHVVWAMAALVCLIMLTAAIRRIGYPLWLFGVLSILVPASTGLMAMLRYTCVIFPLFIICARLGKRRDYDAGLSFFLALLQALLMALWSYTIMT